MSSDVEHDANGGLLQLPEAALDLVLQNLESRSLACTAATCSKLSRMAPANTSKISLRSRDARVRRFAFWLERHNTSLTSLVQCAFVDERQSLPHMHGMKLPWPQLHEMHLEKVDLGAAGEFPSVLHGCTGLTALKLRWCKVQDKRAASAAMNAIAALSTLEHLDLTHFVDDRERVVEVHPELQPLTQLTHLSLDLALESQQLQDLTSSANLVHLSLPNIIHAGVPGVLPFQLVKLTFLQIDCCAGDTPEQLQHLSCLTALQELSVAWRASNHLPGFEGNVPSIEHLSKLLSLKVKGLSTITHSPDSSSTSTHSWARLTALKCLHLEECPVQLEVLATCTQLQALSLRHVQVPYYGDAAVTELSDAVSALSLLTKLTL